MSFDKLCERLQGEFDNYDDGQWESAEEALSNALIEYAVEMKREYWVDEEVRNGQAASSILVWLKENDGEAFNLALKDPEGFIGHPAIDRAMEKLGLVKSWGQVDPQDTHLDDVNYDLYQQYKYDTEY